MQEQAADTQEHTHRLFHTLLQLHHPRSLEDVPSPSSDMQAGEGTSHATQTTKQVNVSLSQKPKPRQRDCNSHPFSYSRCLLRQTMRPHAPERPACRRGPSGPPPLRPQRISRRSHHPRKPRHLLLGRKARLFVLASPRRNAHQHVHTGHYENNKKQSTPLTCSVSREEEKNSTAVFALLNALQTYRRALQPYAS